MNSRGIARSKKTGVRYNYEIAPEDHPASIGAEVELSVVTEDRVLARGRTSRGETRERFAALYEVIS